MNLTTFSSRAAAALVAAVAGFSSYQHIVAVATHAGEHRTVALVLPLAIDGLIVVGTMAMLEDKRAARAPRVSARLALAFGIVATLAANIASAHPTWTARMVAAVPAVSFLIAVEVLARAGRRTVTDPVNTPLAPATEPATNTPAAQALTAVMDATVATPEPATTTPRRPAKKAPAKAATGRQSNAAKVAAAVAKNPAMTQADVAARLQLGERTVQRYWPKPAPAITHANGYDHSTAEVN